MIDVVVGELAEGVINLALPFLEEGLEGIRGHSSYPLSQHFHHQRGSTDGIYESASSGAMKAHHTFHEESEALLQTTEIRQSEVAPDSIQTETQYG